MFEDNKKIGMGLLLAAGILTFLGAILLFQRPLFILANLCFLAGLYFIIGLQRTFSFFMKKGRQRGTAMFFAGFVMMVMLNFTFSTFLGFLLQMSGLLVVFKNFLPILIDYTYSIPVVGSSLRKVLEFVTPAKKTPDV